jgi:hypothetical protein
VVNLPPAARRIADGVTAGLTAAEDQDAAAFRVATADLALLDAEQVRLVLGAMVASMLEASFPDGLAAADLRLLVERTMHRAAWFGAAQVPALVVVLTNAVGIRPDDEPDDVPHLAVVQHAALLVAELAATPSVRAREHLAAAFAEIARDQTVELP